jgi:thiamine-monophosphate kinase
LLGVILLKKNSKLNKSIKEVGEREIISLIQKNLSPMPKITIPFGDDVSAFELDKKKLAVIKTDMLTSKTDIPNEMSLWQAARKAIVMNVSDFASKGVKPSAAIVSLGLPNTFSLKNVKEIACGLNAGAREYDTYIIGGDIGETSDLIIAVSLFGTSMKKGIMQRKGANIGDIVAVTGQFGKTAAGLKILINEINVLPKLRKPLVSSVCFPKARLQEGLALRASKSVTSSIDSSDGLAWSLFELSRSNKLGFLINKIPIADEVREFAESNGLDPFELAFYGGEEYELVITLKSESLEKTQKNLEKNGSKLIPIGKVIKEQKMFAIINGKKEIIESRGWEHFKNIG